MTSNSNMIDSAAEALLQALALAEIRPDGRSRAAVDAAVHRLHRLTMPRLRTMIRHFGLLDHSDDAEQAALVTLVDAARRWDPTRSGFTTWLGWRWRGALIGLRRQLLGDGRTTSGRQRSGAVQLASLGAEEGAAMLADLADPDAEDAVEQGAADWLAQQVAMRLLDDTQAAMPLSPNHRRLLRGLAGRTRRYCNVT